MENLFINYKKWWLLSIPVTILIFIAIGLLVEQAGYSTIVLFVVIGLSVIVILGTIHRQAKKIENRVRDAELELQAAGGLYEFMKTKLPLNLGDWAITAYFLNRMIKEIYQWEPELVVECGSGTFTLVTSSCLKDIGKGRVISLDHLAGYAEKTRNLLEIEELDEWANVVTAPLQKYELDIGTFQWYGEEFREHINEKIDMLIIDGPPAPLQGLSRYPAVPLLKEFLADECLIMLDDGNREDEKEIAQRWCELLGADMEFNKNCKGYYLLKICHS